MICRSCRTDNDDAAPNCRACGRSPLALAKGEILAGRFEVIDLLGSGGMGVVYRARDRTLDEEVALKVLRPEFARSREASQRFFSEIKLARKVSDRHVCNIHEYGDERGLRYICMELVEGVNLKQLVEAEGGLPADEAYEAAIQIAEGLSAIHEAGVIHRDLKTPNIMRDVRGVVRLMDFGIAKDLESPGLTVAGQVICTPEYMSPEQALGQKLDFRTDIYSLGIVVYELFTGQVPFRGDTPMATALKQVEQSPVLEGHVPDPVVPVLAKALAKDRALRFASARGVAAALRLAREKAFAVQASEPAPAPLPGHAAAAHREPASPTIVSGDFSAAAPSPSATSPTASEAISTGPLNALARELRPGGDASAQPTTTQSMAMAAVRLGPILKDLQSDDESVRWRAVLGLGAIGQGSRPALLALLATLTDEDEVVRRAAVSALGRLGTDAREAVPALVRALKDEGLREAAVDSLVKIGLPAVPALLDAVQHGTSVLRWQAAEALTRIGRAG